MQHDLLDETALPLFGLSASTIAAIAVGGALGTLARYLFEVHHPVADGRFPWVTLVVNLSGSLAIGFLIPLTERASGRAPRFGPCWSSGSWADGPPTPPWPSSRPFSYVTGRPAYAWPTWWQRLQVGWSSLPRVTTSAQRATAQ